MSGFTLPNRYALVAVLACLASPLAQAGEWRLAPGPHRCPIQRLDTKVRAPAAGSELVWSAVATAPPATETAPEPMVDPPTRAGFAGPNRFVCCGKGAADLESCEVTDLKTGVTKTIALDPESALPDAIRQLDDRPVWPFPGLEVAWSETLANDPDAATQSRATLRHPASGATRELDAVAAPVAGTLRLWGVRTAPDGARFALIRHLYFGENTDVYPVTVFAAAGPPQAVYLEAARTASDSVAAKDAARMARVLAGPSPRAPR